MQKDLVSRIREGDKEAFAELYDEYAEYALRVATAITKNSADASDAVQETFIKVYRNINSFDKEKPFKPWFYKILVNECNRIIKQSSRIVLMDEYLHDDSLGYHKDNYRYEEYEELYAAIQSLKEINRVPIILKYLIGFMENEIADILDINVNTVKSRLFKGRERLRKILENMQERRIKNG